MTQSWKTFVVICSFKLRRNRPGRLGISRNLLQGLDLAAGRRARLQGICLHLWLAEKSPDALRFLDSKTPPQAGGYSRCCCFKVQTIKGPSGQYEIIPSPCNSDPNIKHPLWNHGSVKEVHRIGNIWGSSNIWFEIPTRWCPQVEIYLP